MNEFPWFYILNALFALPALAVTLTIIGFLGYILLVINWIALELILNILDELKLIKLRSKQFTWFRNMKDYLGIR